MAASQLAAATLPAVAAAGRPAASSTTARGTTAQDPRKRVSAPVDLGVACRGAVPAGPFFLCVQCVGYKALERRAATVEANPRPANSLASRFGEGVRQTPIKSSVLEGIFPSTHASTHSLDAPCPPGSDHRRIVSSRHDPRQFAFAVTMLLGKAFAAPLGSCVLNSEAFPLRARERRVSASPGGACGLGQKSLRSASNSRARPAPAPSPPPLMLRAPAPPAGPGAAAPPPRRQRRVHSPPPPRGRSPGTRSAHRPCRQS